MKLIILISLAAVACIDATEEDLCLEDLTNSYGSDINTYGFQPTPKPYKRAAAFTEDLSRNLKTWAERFPAIKRMMDSKTTTLPVELQRVTNNGYTHYSQSAAMQAIEGVDGVNFEAFTKYLVDTLEITGNNAEQFRASMEVVRLADNNDWRLIDVIFDQGSGANCKYICVLGHRDEPNDVYDFMVADFKSSFKLAPDLVLIEERKSYAWGLIQRANIRVEKIPAAIKLEDVELLKSFFSQAALSRFAKMLDVQVPGYPEPFVDPLTAIGIISAGLDVVGKVLNLFKTTSTSTIIKEVAGEGFTKYVQSSRTSVTEGMSEMNVAGRYLRLLPVLLKMDANSEVFKGVKAAICIGLLGEKQTWSDFKVAFSQDKGHTNRVAFADMVVQQRADGKFNLVAVNVDQEFDLAPDVQYIQNDKSYVGGIYSTSKIERKVYPRSLTDKDLEVLVGFFHITVFKRLGIQYNVPVPPIPEKPDMK